MTAYTWDGTNYVDKDGKPASAHPDKYGGYYVYEENPAEHDRQMAERHASYVARLETKPMEEATMTAHTINTPLSEITLRECARQLALVAEKRRLAAEGLTFHPAPQGWTASDAALTGQTPPEVSPSMQYLLIEARTLGAENDRLRQELVAEKALNLTLRTWMAQANDYARGFADGLAGAQTLREFREAVEALPKPDPVTEQHAPLHRAIGLKP